VMAFIVLNAIAVIFTVRLVVLVVIGDEIVECEAVVAGHKVHTCLGFAFFVAVNLRAAEQTVGKRPNCVVVTAKKAADIIAEPPIPLSPVVANEATDLIESGRVPRFGDELGTG